MSLFNIDDDVKDFVARTKVSLGEIDSTVKKIRHVAEEGERFLNRLNRIIDAVATIDNSPPVTGPAGPTQAEVEHHRPRVT